MDKPVALVLGGTAPHRDLIFQLKERGFYTILVDYLENPVAKSAADEHIQESTLDRDGVLNIARQTDARLVISACVDHANVSACYALEKLGLHAPYSFDIAERITDKGVMKREMLKHRIPTSKYFYVDGLGMVPDGALRYPVIVKPADSNTANGVKKALNTGEMEEYLQSALQISRSGRAVVEEFIQGREISAYCFVKDHKAKLLMTAERISVIDGEARALKCFATIAPARISSRAASKAEKLATEIAEMFHLDNTPLHVQYIVDNDEIYVIEFAPRVGGGLSYKTIRENTGFDILGAAIDSYLGNPVSLESWHEPKGIYTINIIYGKDGVYAHIDGAEQLVKDGIVEDFVAYKTRGTRLDSSRASSSRVGAFIVYAEQEDDLCEKIRTAFDRLHVYGDGIDLIRRDLSLDVYWDQISS